MIPLLAVGTLGSEGPTEMQLGEVSRASRSVIQG